MWLKFDNYLGLPSRRSRNSRWNSLDEVMMMNVCETTASTTGVLVEIRNYICILVVLKLSYGIFYGKGRTSSMKGVICCERNKSPLIIQPLSFCSNLVSIIIPLTKT